jgi:hypothetical protein
MFWLTRMQITGLLYGAHSLNDSIDLVGMSGALTSATKAVLGSCSARGRLTGGGRRNTQVRDRYNSEVGELHAIAHDEFLVQEQKEAQGAMRSDTRLANFG